MTTPGDRPLRSAHKSYTGGSHERSGKPLQDSSYEFRCRDYAIVSVADGHGSDRYVRSHLGSKLAAEISIKVIKEYYRAAFGELVDNPDETLNSIIRTIIARWNSAVTDHFQKNPLDDIERELIGDRDMAAEKYYGTTLLTAFISKEFAFGLQIGDGEFAIERGDIVEMPMEDDPECVGNRTSSLCDVDSFSRFRRWFTTDVPDAMMICTDGLSTTFLTEEDMKDYFGRMMNLCIKENKRWELVGINLEKRARAGHEDDISVGLVGFGNPRR